MVQTLSKHPKAIACFFISLFYAELITPVFARASENTNIKRSYFPISFDTAEVSKNVPFTHFENNLSILHGNKKSETDYRQKTFKHIIKNLGGGPTQPEMQAFSSVNNSNMVDLFSGDFSYNIPLMDVGGYPINLAYRSGISMDQESSWVGLGWNVNPGTITRNMRGLPDDFTGSSDSIKKVSSIKENRTIGVTTGANVELGGLPLNVGVSAGIFNNNYKGWGLEYGLNASINSGAGSKGPLTGGLGITNNSQDGLTVSPSLSLNINQQYAEQNAGLSGGLTISSPYNSRYGIKALQLNAGLRQYGNDEDNQKYSESSFSSSISFASPSYTPYITMPLTSRQYSFTAKVGTVIKTLHPSFYISAYVSRQSIDAKDTLLSLPAYGYLNYQDGAKNSNALLDFNREKELTYREKPAVPHIALPIYTYDAFSITGEGTGGMFRAYRGDIGFVFDHSMRTKDESDRASIDVGPGDTYHGGVDLNINRSYTQNGPWLNQNVLKNTINFKENKGTYEASYFRNPGEKAINSQAFYKAIGGDDVVAAGLFQSDRNSPIIQTTNLLNHYQGKRLVAVDTLKAATAYKIKRDKRTQVISYLTAREAQAAGHLKFIENYTFNNFNLSNCLENQAPVEQGSGLIGEYFSNPNFQGKPLVTVLDTVVDFNFGRGRGRADDPLNPVPINFPSDNFSVRWTGRIKAPVTGPVIFTVRSDDGNQLWVNDSLIINAGWNPHRATDFSDTINLIQGEIYKIKVNYYELKKDASISLQWAYAGQAKNKIYHQFLFPPAIDTFRSSTFLSKEERVNKFRKPNHISEINVLNNDGRTYVYGIPVYNLKQKEATFSVNANARNGNARSNKGSGLIKIDTSELSTRNRSGKDWYYSSDEMPAYAHSFLLSGILSPDYTDVTGNGITDDDLGDAIKFNYSKLSGITNPYKWRAPYVQDSVSYNEGLRTDSRDDKGNYVAGEKELWYMHSIHSKTMVATFTLEDRLDLPAINDTGKKYQDNAKRLKEINLYSKADLLKNLSNARPIKTVHFEYSYELCKGVNKPVNDTGKLTLKKVWFTYNGNNKKIRNPYIFNYNKLNPDYTVKSYDRWGNYKDPLQNPGSKSGNIIGNAEYSYAIQDSITAANNAAAWALDSIYLPSGGSMKINYESDDYAYVQNKRAMQMCKILGLGKNASLSGMSSKLYDRTADNLYLYISVPETVGSKDDVFKKYLSENKKLFFKIFVEMPKDDYGSGKEYVSGYADIDPVNGYGVINDHTIWIKVSGISFKGDQEGSYSPLAKTALQFLRMNLPSKAYPNSEIGDNVSVNAAVRLIAALDDNFISTIKSFDGFARGNNWVNDIDTSRSYVRLESATYKKYGGGHRVKSINIYDNWDKMTQQRASIYGQQYTYTTKKEIFGTVKEISSGVASYEPGVGGEENPFRQPIEYIERIAPLAPISLAYSEEPLGESFFPSAGIGYSKIRVRTINFKNKKSANGYEETMFYTAYDFPTYTDRSLIDNSTRKRYKPTLANFLRINAQHYLSITQGFKIELNDMHGKLRSQASYPETDANNPITYTENVYKVESSTADFKRLSNKAMVISPDGSIDSTGVIGKDIELMTDMREQQSITNGYNINLNADLFTIPFFPGIFLFPSLINLAQREENLFRSVAMVKIIQRYGILDSVTHIDKGSRVTTKDLMYDSETGDVLLTKTQNEFNDPVFNFTYPGHWAYDGMGLAYKNINVAVQKIDIRNGKIQSGLPEADSILFSSGDEILVAGKQKAGNEISCGVPYSYFPAYAKIWAIDSNVLRGGPKNFYFIDKDGKPYNGHDISLKVIRSGRKNILGANGSITSLLNPVVKNVTTNQYDLVLNTSTKVVNAVSNEFRQFWQINDIKKKKTSIIIDSASYTKTWYPTKSLIYYQIRQDSTHLFYADGTSVIDTTSKKLISSNQGHFSHPGSPSPGFFITSLLKFDSINIIPSTAVVQSANLFLFASDSGFRRPQYPNAHSNTFAADSYHEPFKIGVASNYWAQSDSVSAISSIYINSANYSYHVISSNSNIVVPATDFISNWRSSGNTGLVFQPDYYTDTLSYTTYASQRVTDTSKRPKLVITYKLPISSIDTTTSLACLSIVTDTLLNPYATGVLGNWRANKNYTYFTKRAESDPAATTNIRKDGTFNDFVPFWNFQNNVLKPTYDTIKWVWNSEITLVNKKGLEIENKDPLGRFNAGLYGYNLSMPTAVIQNAHYRESAFEGFEDYGYATQCDSVCAPGRHFDYSAFASKFDTLQKHTGKSSLKLTNDAAALSFNVVSLQTDSIVPALTFSTATDPLCTTAGTLLKDIKVSNSVLLPTFSPFKSKKMILSAWVKEGGNCQCSFYSNNTIRILFDNVTPGLSFIPSGNIIEGWQRYESVFDIPSSSSTITVSLQASNGATVYFDDLRLLPFNANMKSFVYHPINLRLMAELDENNYATFYEYDDDGTLIRTKKETERGIKTIKETRSALYKQ